jgi:hypothetical protein
MFSSAEAFESADSVNSRLAGGLAEKRLNDLLQVCALALRAVNLLFIVLRDGQHFGKLVLALPADVFVKRHSFPIGLRFNLSD